MENVTIETVAKESVEGRKLRTEEGDSSPKAVKSKLNPYQVIAKVVGEMTYNSRNSAMIESWMTDILCTICAINALPEHATGLRVGDVHYLFSEYQLPARLGCLLTPAKVVLTDVPSAKDFLDRSQFNTSFGSVLTPDEMSQYLLSVASKSRLKWSYTSVSREKVGLLAGEIEFAVYANKVVSDKQKRIIYLTQKFDDQAQCDVNRWARQFAASIYATE